ncbi:MAG: Fic family protein [Hyphomicrobiales bacterium]|nr:Fic family protein [Hyphomicrobiales bacterium]MBW0002583.1 Fic family protein [Hyphomicrobiales bacterium]
MHAGDRFTSAQEVELITDVDEKAHREAENGIRQFELAIEIIRAFVKDRERPFRLRQGIVLELHAKALQGIHLLSGTFRNGPVEIHGSGHVPPGPLKVADEVSDLCDYVNTNWNDKSAIHLAAYVLWRLNWIHPFADGNGRTARAVSYVVLSIKLDSLLPGTKTIPDQIADDKRPYYEALEAADMALEKTKNIDLSQLEGMLSQMLLNQLAQAAREAGTA